ncbi:MAG: site-2 protease family protein, partial [Thermoleophilaceae bacterium]|nr:site-2 protease family protein [Thermoleophilaceae bacterium]
MADAAAHGAAHGSRGLNDRPRPERGSSGPLQATFSLGRWAGVDVGANWSWVIIVWLVVWSLAAEVFPTDVPGLSDGAYIAMAVTGTLVFFASLLLHELGHAVVARREGMEIDGITLWLFGGVARFKGMFPSARAELRIALAGPAVSLLLGLGFLGAGALPVPDAVGSVATWLGRINLFLLAFNMIPALPLDGGRVLRSLIWRATGDFTGATRTAGAIGAGIGNLMIALGVLMLFVTGSFGGLWLALIGLFVSGAAKSETSMATTRSALAGLHVGDAMVREPDTLPADMTIAAFVGGPFARSRHASYPVRYESGRIGLLFFRDVGNVPPDRWERETVGSLAVAPDATLAPDDELGDALMHLAQTRTARTLVLDEGRLAG